MDKMKAPDLAKYDFDNGNPRFMEVFKEAAKEGESDKWEIPASKEIGKKILERFSQRAHVEPDFTKDQKVFKKDEANYATAYNKAMKALLVERDKTLLDPDPPKPKNDAAPKDNGQKKDSKAVAASKPAAKPAAKPPAEKPPPPPPVIIDSGDIPMDKVKPYDLAKTDIERGKIRFVETYKEDSKKPGSGKWEAYFAKEIGKELLEKYPDRIRVEKKPDVDPKKFQKDEGSFASAYNKTVFKSLNPDAPMFKPPPPKQNDKKKEDASKKPAEQPKTAQDKKPEEVKQPEKPVEAKPADIVQQKLEQAEETPQKLLETKDAQPAVPADVPARDEKPEQKEKVEEKPAEPAQAAPAGKIEEPKKPEAPPEPQQPADKPAEKIEEQMNQ